jgi:prevent-host-death family protein
MAIKKVNVHEAKANLSRYLDRVEQGDTVIICRRNVPVAELRPVVGEPKRRARPLGRSPGSARMTDDFDVLPDDLVAAFEGREP